MSISERLFLTKIVILTALVRVGLWLLPFRKMRKIVSSLAGSTRQSEPALWPSVAQIANAVMDASRYVPAANCLTQAFTMQIVLGYYGHKSSLRIGVARSKNGEFQAHAWVESESRVVIGGTAEELARNYVNLPAIEMDS